MNKDKLSALHELVVDKQHTRTGLFNHLVGTWSLLRHWGEPEFVCDAGLFHAVYGTAHYHSRSLSQNHRSHLQALIGMESERLCHLFGILDRNSLLEAARWENGNDYSVQHYNGEESCAVDFDTIKHLCAISAANWIEQRDNYPRFQREINDSKYKMISIILPTGVDTYLSSDIGKIYLGNLDFCRLLSWTDPAYVILCVETAAREYQKNVSISLGQLFHNDGAPFSAQSDVYDRLTALPNSSLLRILQAPETCRLLYLTKAEMVDKQVEWLEGAVAVEESLLGCTNASDQGRWSAFGDFFLPIGEIQKPERTAAAVFDNGMIVDFDSPYAKTSLIESNFRPRFGKFEPFSVNERTRVLSHIKAAVSGLDVWSPSASMFYNKFVKTVIPRIDMANQTYKGSSNRGIIGRVNIYNPHLPYICNGNIATSLVHEAIHIMLYIFEQRYKIFYSIEYAHNNFVESPFSGKRVHILALVHAIAVWFALLNLWMLHDSSEVFSDEVRLYFISFCAKGFSGDTLIRRLEPHFRQIDGHIVAEILAMHRFAGTVLRNI